MSSGGNGVILERLSGKKLSILVSILALLQLTFFLIGALMFPNSTHTETVEGTMCRETNHAFKSNEHIYYLRDNLGHTNANCQRVQVDENRNIVLDASANEIVYAFQVPLPRDDRVLRMHRFFQTMTAILQLQVLFPPSLKSASIDENPLSPKNAAQRHQHHDEYNIDHDYDHDHYEEDSTKSHGHAVTHPITLRAKLAHHSSRQLDHEWNVFASAKVNKEFTCYKNRYSLDCDMIQLFELGSVFHEFYAINVKLDEKTAKTMMDAIKNAAKESFNSVHELPDARLTLTFIYQTGGFTQMWLTMKSVIFPFVLFIMCWSWNRIAQLERNANLLEKNLLALGLSLTLLNLPVEWFTLIFDMPWILIYADVRQGIFYAALFTFWIIFCGEHLMDENQTSICTTMKSYWKYISGIWVGFVCLLGFEIANRGMQLSDPFFSIWDTKKGSDLAMVMLVIASLSAIFYFGLLLYMVARVFYNFHIKQAQLPGMNRMRRAFYEGIIYRFKFLLAATLFCAATTVAFFIVNNVNETQWRFHDELPILNYNAGFYTGVYGMWNIYVVAVMIFYAPSHKNKPLNQNQGASNENEETVEFVNLQTRLTSGTSTESVLTAFANKISSS